MWRFFILCLALVACDVDNGPRCTDEQIEECGGDFDRCSDACGYGGNDQCHADCMDDFCYCLMEDSGCSEQDLVPIMADPLPQQCAETVG
jgi:hypothetical protein